MKPYTVYKCNFHSGTGSRISDMAVGDVVHFLTCYSQLEAVEPRIRSHYTAGEDCTGNLSEHHGGLGFRCEVEVYTKLMATQVRHLFGGFIGVSRF